jgi:glyoxylase-like metal-dependent hydrolase (beta-lactamase superfamily II)
MEVQKLGNRGLLFIFPDFIPYPQVPMPIHIYVIKGKNFLFICDTGVKKEQMYMVKEHLTEKKFLSRPIIIFNSHFHMDHIGGNGVFESAEIISHKSCLEKMVKMIKNIKKRNEARLSDKSIAYPKMTFQEKIFFPEDNIVFFYSPGHSEDSASCYDQLDKVLYVGDNLVDPIPFLTWHRLDKYLTTLQNYCNLEIKTFVLGHKSVFNDISFIKESINYIKNFQNFNIDISNFTPQHAAWFRWSFIYIGLALKENGKEKEALKYFEYIKDIIRNPIIKPLIKEELEEIEDFLDEELTIK